MLCTGPLPVAVPTLLLSDTTALGLEPTYEAAIHNPGCCTLYRNLPNGRDNPIYADKFEKIQKGRAMPSHFPIIFNFLAEVFNRFPKFTMTLF